MEANRRKSKDLRLLSPLGENISKIRLPFVIIEKERIASTHVFLKRLAFFSLPADLIEKYSNPVAIMAMTTIANRIPLKTVLYKAKTTITYRKIHVNGLE